MTQNKRLNYLVKMTSEVSLAILLCLAAFFLTGCGKTPQADSATNGAPLEETGGANATTATTETGESGETTKTATIMVYLTGSDLESAAAAGTSDMEEMAKSGIDLSCTNLLVYTGGSSLWHSSKPEIPADANVLYRLTESGYEQVETFDLLSMGDPENLRRFLQYSYERFPAESYDLILWDHGNGPVIGYGSDKQFGGDSLTLQEMRQALEGSPFGADNPLSLMGFDACLMSSAELVCTLDEYADYLVASQETEPSFGWNYGFLEKCGKISAEDLGREIVGEYREYAEKYSEENEFFHSDNTLALIDLSGADALEKAINDLFEKAANDVSGDYAKLAAARVRSHGFGRASTGSEYDLVDLESLASQMEDKYPAEVKALREAVDQAVVMNYSNIDESCGLSLFYPYYNKNYYRKTWRDVYQALDVFPAYSAYLQRYDQVWLGTDLLDLYEGELVPRQGTEARTYTLQLTQEQYENYADARYYIMCKMSDEVYAPVYSSGDVREKNGLLTAEFDGNVIYVSDDYGEKEIPYMQMFETTENVTDYVTAQMLERPSQTGERLHYDALNCEIQLSVDRTSGDVTVKGIYAGDSQTELTSGDFSALFNKLVEWCERDTSAEIGSGKKIPVDVSEWQYLYFIERQSRYLTRDPSGRILPYEEWEASSWLSYSEMAFANGVHFTYEPLYQDGYEYYVMFEIQDVQGNRVSSELLPITLEEAPEREKEQEVTEIQWDQGSSVELFHADGLTLELCFINDADKRKKIYMIRGVNENNYGVTVDLEEDLLVNGNFSAGTGFFYMELEPGTEAYEEIDGVTNVCNFMGKDDVRSLRLTLRAKRAMRRILFMTGRMM